MQFLVCLDSTKVSRFFLQQKTDSWIDIGFASTKLQTAWFMTTVANCSQSKNCEGNTAVQYVTFLMKKIFFFLRQRKKISAGCCHDLPCFWLSLAKEVRDTLETLWLMHRCEKVFRIFKCKNMMCTKLNCYAEKMWAGNVSAAFRAPTLILACEDGG